MPLKDVDMTGKICLVTGASSGIGTTTALGLARMNATVVLVCRSHQKGEATIARIGKETNNTTSDLLLADLASLEQIRDLVERFQKKYDRLDVLINNAGLIARNRQTTEDGFEMQFAVNHLAPFLLTNLLLDTLKGSAPSRVVTVSSTAHTGGTIRFDDLQSERRYTAWGAYGQSKLANILFTKELARRLEETGVTANCLHPGVVRTGILRNLNPILRAAALPFGIFFMGPEKGARTTLYLATAPELQNVSGKYFAKEAEAPVSLEANDPEIAKRLWDVSEELTGLNKAKTPGD